LHVSIYSIFQLHSRQTSIAVYYTFFKTAKQLTSYIIHAPMNNTSFDLVIFDCDGVLVDSEPLANQVYVQILGEHGYQVNKDEYLRGNEGVRSCCVRLK